MSRNIRCDLDYPAESVSPSPPASKIELLERIRKLEELVETKESRHDGGEKQRSRGSETHVQQTNTPTPSPHIERLDDDVAWLESIYNGQDFSVDIINVQQRSRSN